MASVTVNEFIPDGPNKEVVNITADDGQTYEIRTGKGVKAAIFQPNVDNAETSSWGVTFTKDSTTVTINLTGNTSDVTGTLVVWTKG